MLADEHSTESRESESIIKDNIVMGKKLRIEGNLNIGSTVLHSLSEHPDFFGMIDAKTGEQIRFGEMKDRSIRCALWLRKQGVSENDVVGLSTPIQMNDYVPYLATLYVNAVVNPWHYDASKENTQHFFETCRPKVIFACKDSIDKLVEIATKKGIHCEFVVFEKHENYVTLQEIMAEQTQDEVANFECTVPLEPRKKVSRIIFSSGTTGKPKAVLHSYHSLLAGQMEEYGMHSGMTCLWFSTFSWITGGILTLAAIRLRCTRIIHRQFDPEVTGTIVDKYKIDFIFLRPYLLMLCHQKDIFKRYDFAHVKTIIFGGTKINKTILEECQKSLPHTRMIGLYGTTEAAGLISSQIRNCKYIDSVGYPSRGIKLKVVDPNTGAVLGPNQEGEIYYKTDYAMLGYLDNPDETQKTMDEEGWLRSGDLGSYDEDGEVMIGDRLKAMIKTRFYTISPFEFEEILMKHPDVDNCAVVGVEHPIDIERPFVFVVKTRDARVTVEELIEFVENKNERYRLMIDGLVFVNELPYTQTGKKHLRKLQQMAKVYIEQERFSNSS